MTDSLGTLDATLRASRMRHLSTLTPHLRSATAGRSREDLATPDDLRRTYIESWSCSVSSRLPGPSHIEAAFGGWEQALEVLRGKGAAAEALSRDTTAGVRSVVEIALYLQAGDSSPAGYEMWRRSAAAPDTRTRPLPYIVGQFGSWHEVLRIIGRHAPFPVSPWEPHPDMEGAVLARLAIAIRDAPGRLYTKEAHRQLLGRDSRRECPSIGLCEVWLGGWDSAVALAGGVSTLDAVPE